MRPLKLRCSALPRAFLCPGSVRPCRVEINPISDAADLGTAAHEGLAQLVETGRVEWGAVPELACRHDVPEDDLRLLLAQGQKLWSEVRESFPDAVTEVELRHEAESVTLTGHADIYARSADTVHIGDWKGGRKDHNYREQLIAYAALALLEDDSLEAATAGVLWVRELEYEHYTLRRADLRAWVERLVVTIVAWDGTYRPGPHCAYCPRNHECHAANALIRRDVAAIGDESLIESLEDESAIAMMAPDAIIALLGKADLVSKLAERVRTAVRQHVQRHGDIVGTEQRLTMQPEERRRLNVVDAFTVLEAEGFGDEEWGVVLDFSLPKTERIVATRAGKGKGAGAVRALRAKLEQANAIQKESVAKLVTRRN